MYWWGIGGATIFWLICLVFHVYIVMSIRHYPMFIVSIIEAACGTLLVCLASKWLFSYKWTNSICLIGRHTLAVMCIHHLDLYWINWGNLIHLWLVAAVVRLILDLLLLAGFLAIRKFLVKGSLKGIS